MEIQVLETDYCKLNVHYEANAEQISSKRKEVVNLFKKAPVPGFRKGKATLDIIKNYYRSQIEESLKRALAEEAYHNTIFDKKIKPFGTPNFTRVMLSPFQFICDFSISKKPDFELAQYKGLNIPKPQKADSAELTENLLQDVRVKYGEAVPYTEGDFTLMNDNVIINYEAFDGETKLENLCFAGELLTIGNSQLPGFDENLLGMNVGDTREFFINIPESGLPSVAGKNIKFSVTLVNGSKVVPAALDDELAKKLGMDSFNDLRTHVAGVASARIEEKSRNEITKQISSQLCTLNTFKVPDWLALSEAQYLASKSNLNWDTLQDADRVKYISMGDENVKLALVLDRIRDSEPEAQLSDQEVISMIKENIKKSNQEMDEVLQQMSKNGYLPILVARLRDEFTLDFIVKNSNIIE